ncbi:hypothetical protein N9Y89_02005 [bacterium]|nr:hypothetical protein [bacterium]
MPNWVEKFFFVFSFVAQGSSYMSPKVYGILHRLHHEHADKEEDPHSPLFSTNFVTLMVKTYHKFACILNNTTNYSTMHHENVLERNNALPTSEELFS